jgi:hypothetical protein
MTILMYERLLQLLHNDYKQRSINLSWSFVLNTACRIARAILNCPSYVDDIVFLTITKTAIAS